MAPGGDPRGRIDIQYEHLGQARLPPQEKLPFACQRESALNGPSEFSHEKGRPERVSAMPIDLESPKVIVATQPLAEEQQEPAIGGPSGIPIVGKVLGQLNRLSADIWHCVDVAGLPIGARRKGEKAAIRGNGDITRILRTVRNRSQRPAVH